MLSYRFYDDHPGNITAAEEEAELYAMLMINEVIVVFPLLNYVYMGRNLLTCMPKRRLKSASASTQSDQCLRSSHEETLFLGYRKCAQ